MHGAVLPLPMRLYGLVLNTSYVFMACCLFEHRDDLPCKEVQSLSLHGGSLYSCYITG